MLEQAPVRATGKLLHGRSYRAQPFGGKGARGRKERLFPWCDTGPHLYNKALHITNIANRITVSDDQAGANGDPMRNYGNPYLLAVRKYHPVRNKQSTRVSNHHAERNAPMSAMRRIRVKTLLPPTIASLISAVLLISVSLLVASPPAHADNTRAFTRCTTGSLPDRTFTASIVPPASGAFLGFDGGITSQYIPRLANGDVIRVRASGGIKTDGWPWTPFFSPNGVSDPAPTDWPGPTLNKMSLIGKMNFASTNTVTKGNMPLGADSKCFTVSSPAGIDIFYAAINDVFPADNSGSWTITLSLFKANLS